MTGIMLARVGAGGFGGRTDNLTGAGTVTVPSGASFLTVTYVRSASGGGAIGGDGNNGAGGGGGAQSTKTAVAVVFADYGATFTYSVGTKGLKQPAPDNATAGGDTTLSGTLVSGAIAITCTGGGGGTSGDNSGSPGGAGGTASGGTVNNNGSAGQPGASGSAGGAGGGSAPAGGNGDSSGGNNADGSDGSMRLTWT